MLGVDFDDDTLFSVPEPRLPAVDCPNPRWSATSSLTLFFPPPVLFRDESSSPGVPVADAVASELALEDASAVKLTPVPALMLRAVVASAECSASVKPIEKPRALSGAVVSPVAFDDTDADCTADRFTAPDTLKPPTPCVPIKAFVDTIE